MTNFVHDLCDNNLGGTFIGHTAATGGQPSYVSGTDTTGTMHGSLNLAYSTGTGRFKYADATPGSADYYCEGKFYVYSAMENHCGVLARVQSDNSFYALTYYSGAWHLNYYNSSGTPTEIDSGYTQSLTADTYVRVKLDVTGTTVTAYQDYPSGGSYSQILQGTDTNIANAGSAGVSMGGSSSFLDDFDATDGGAPPEPPPPGPPLLGQACL